MKKFAKLFEFGELGQVLVTRDYDSEEGDSIAFRFSSMFNGKETQARFSLELGDNADTADAAFEKVDEEMARIVIESSPKDIKEFMSM